MSKSVAILVLSCDRYSDIWIPFFGEFFRFWPDCPYKVYLESNLKTFNDERVTTIAVGEDKDWSSSLKLALEKISEEFVLFFYEDAILSENVDTKAIENLVEWGIKRQVNYLRLNPSPKPDVRVNEELGKLLPASMYRTSLFSSLVRKETLQSLLRGGESAWQFEFAGCERAKVVDNFFGSYKRHFFTVHGVEKGLWLLPASEHLTKLGYNLDFEYRKVMSDEVYKSYHSGRFKKALMSRLSGKWQARIINLKRWVLGKPQGYLTT